MLRAIIVLIVLALSNSAALAEARLALLIGNQGYNAKVGPLTNPHNDIALIGAALEKLGFKTTLVKDADYRSVDTAIKRHVTAVRRAGAGALSFVYYSGHGAADPDTKINYLIPVDVAQADDEDLWHHSLNLNTVIENLRAQAPQATHYVVFDACRNELNLTRKGRKALADKGFAPIAYTPGVMVAYATAPGKTADDRGTGSGPYARALAEEIVRPGVEALTMFRRVALRVNREIGQDPWMAASTLPEVYLAGQVVPTVPDASGRPSEAAEVWSSMQTSTNIAALELFVTRYVNTFYADLAKARILELRSAAIKDAIRKGKAEDTALRAEPLAPGSRRDFVENAGDTVYFDFDRADVKPEFEPRLAAQAAWLRQHRQYRITIEGHNDDRRGADFAVDIAARRAASVREFLIRNGVASDRIQMFSFGMAWPAADCGDESCWARNRRVRIALERPEPPPARK
jgi:outer membrane protein OmpA-like peptidoglycan-associated protein